MVQWEHCTNVVQGKESQHRKVGRINYWILQENLWREHAHANSDFSPVKYDMDYEIRYGGLQ